MPLPHSFPHIHRRVLARSGRWLSVPLCCLALLACGGGQDSPGDQAAAPLASAAPLAKGETLAAAQRPSDALALADAQTRAEAEATAVQAALAEESRAASSSEAPSAQQTEPLQPESRAYRASAQLTGAAAPQLVVRARGTPAGGVAPLMTVRVNGVVLGSVSVSALQPTDHAFSLSSLNAGALVDVVFTNDAVVNGQDRNLYVTSLAHGGRVVLPGAGNSIIDRGAGARAFDGLDTLPGDGTLAWSAALRITWPAAVAVDPQAARKQDAVRFLLQASFGPTAADVQSLTTKPYATWLAEQMALPYGTDFIHAVQSQYARGAAYRPGGTSYNPAWVGQQFWQAAATAPDQLRKRVAFALHQIITVSQADSNLWSHARAYAAYYDLLNRHAFGNYRDLLQDIALSPAMGIYLSHMRNRKEDAATGRMPDENFAREILQLFSIGLHELNADGSPKLDAQGKPIETYTNADVMALAKVFTGWSWALPDAELTEANFRWGGPSYTAAGDRGIDLLPMKAYPSQHSSAAKLLFAGKTWATSLPAGASAQADLKLALDAIFKHPNVGPFIGRQLIQRLVSSNPSPAYVARVAAVFNNNGRGVRGDLGAVVRAILLDGEARNAPPAGFGKLREPVLRVAHWMRALDASTASGQYMMAWEREGTGQRALMPPSVFGYYRAGYVPPNTRFAAAGQTVPEWQIVDESSVAAWINMAEAMAGWGLGWTGAAVDVSVDYAALGAACDGANAAALADHLNLMLLGGRMSATLRQSVIDVVAGIPPGTSSTAHRARAATFLVLASPEYLSQP